MKIPEAVVGAVVPGTTDTIDVVQRPWWYVLRLIRAYPLLYFLSFLSIFAMYVWPVIPANLIRRLFDTLEHPETGVDPRNMVWLLAALLVAQVLARSVTVLGWPAERGLLVAGTALMRHNLLRRILQRPGASALPPGSSPGEAISRLRDDLEHVIHFVDWTADPIGQVTIVSIALVTLMRIDPWITAIAFVPLVMLLTVINWVNRRIQLTRKASAESISAVTGLLGELFGAAQAIKVTGSETRVVAHLQRAGERRRTATLRDTLLNEGIDALAEGTSAISTGLLLIVGAQALQTGRMSIGDFAMFTSYIAHLAFVAGMVGGFVKRYRQMSVSLGRGLALLQGAPTAQLVQPSTDLALWRIPSVKLPNEPPLAHEPLNVFEARDLCYSYPGVGSERHGIQHINFSIRRGEFVVITGRIGSGKTTLLRVLLGLLPADSGTLLWNGSVISDPGSFLTPPHVAYTPQTPRLFGDTLRDNILMGLPLTGSRAADLDAALLQAVLERDIPTLEHGLDTRIGPRGVRLSGGQLQRAAAARMFVRMPDLLVFDDLSSALDTETEQLLWSRLRMRPGVTCIVVSHRETALARADRVIHMKDQ